MSYKPDEKVRLMSGVVISPEWEILCERLDREVKSIEAEISLSLRKQKYDRASHLNGKKEMLEFVKGLPMRIKRENQGIIDRVKEMVNDLAE